MLTTYTLCKYSNIYCNFYDFDIFQNPSAKFFHFNNALFKLIFRLWCNFADFGGDSFKFTSNLAFGLLIIYRRIS